MSKMARFATLAVLVALGCRQSWQPDYGKLNLIEVTGTIRLDGVPLVGARVIFECEDRTFSSGRTNDQGEYRLMFDSERSGVLPGPKVVRIVSYGSGETDVEVPAEASDGSVPKRPEKLPATYGTASNLKVNVDGHSHTVNFDLKSDGSTTGPAS